MAGRSQAGSFSAVAASSGCIRAVAASRQLSLQWCLIASLALGSFLPATLADVHDSAQYLKYYNVEASVKAARESLGKANVTNTADRLAVMLLYSQPITSTEYGPCLKCALAMYVNNLMTHTKADLFLFVKQTYLDSISSLPWIKQVPNLHILLLDETDERSWKMPTWIRPERQWSGGFWPEYRLMGQWRLAFSFPFARELGYHYMLQADTDTFVQQPVPYDLVAFMQQKQLWMTNKNFFFYESNSYYLGLPELAAFWIETRLRHSSGAMVDGVVLTADNATEVGLVGPIFKHCNPSNTFGLRTGPNNQQGVYQGWDARCIAGNFNIFSLDWWFSWEVQDFVQLVLRTGAHIEHRWVDVATLSMIGHLFCPEEKFHVFEDLHIEHGHGAHFLCTPCRENNTGLVGTTL